MTKITYHRDIRQQLWEDGKATDAEKPLLEQHFADKKHRASADHRGIVRDLMDPERVWEPGIRQAALNIARQAGYPVPNAVPAKEIYQAETRRVIAENVSEPDAKVDALVRAMGNGNVEPLTLTVDNGFELTHDHNSANNAANPGEKLNGQDDDGDGLVDNVFGTSVAKGEHASLKGGDHGIHVDGTSIRGSTHIRSYKIHAFEPGFDAKKICAAMEADIQRMHPQTVNMSFKIDDPEEVAEFRALFLRHPEVLFFKSAGNDGKDLRLWDKDPKYAQYAPRTYLVTNQLPNLVTTAAAAVDGTRASFSNYGSPYVLIASPGSDYYSSVANNTYGKKSGTSMASPHSNNVALNVLRCAPSLKPADVIQILIETSTPSEVWGKDQPLEQRAVVSGGLTNKHKACQLGSLVELIKYQGKSAEEASAQLAECLSPQELAELLPLVENYPAKPRPVVELPEMPLTRLPPKDPNRSRLE